MILSYLQLLLRIAGIEAELLLSLEQQPPSQTPNLSCSQKPFLIMTRIIKMKNGNQDEENAEPNTTKRELQKKPLVGLFDKSCSLYIVIASFKIK